ncbi:MAG: TRAP transporter small permease [Fusobacteriaceae bacterium]|jgi:TRAP-type C4-dicarboxylate transport system permease small subunit|nr:TRAP transporter small permease [Fusobacteriaceae bacterium]
METVRKVLKRLLYIEKKMCVIFLIIMLFINFAQVLFRYVINQPFSWSEEIILIFLSWFGFLCMSIDIENDSHVAIVGLYSKFSPSLKKIADIVRHGLLSTFFALMIKYGYQLTAMTIRKKMPASQLSQGWQYAPLLLGGIIMFTFSIVNLISVFIGKKENDNIKVVK